MKPGVYSAFLLPVAFLSLAPAVPAQTGPRMLSFHSSVDDSDQPYALYVPPSFAPEKQYPLVISLHAEQTNERLNLRQVFGLLNRFGDLPAADLRYFRLAKDRGFIVACPFARGTMGYEGIAEQDVYDVVSDVERRYPVDRDRVYLTGISMGGGGALRLALTRPDLWAAVAPVSPAFVPGTEDLAANALDLPIRVYQGEQDPFTPAEGAREWQSRLLDAGVESDYIEYPGVRHNAWEMAYRNGAVFDWFAKFRRERFPPRVHLLTRSYRYASAYWVRIDGLTPGVLASIDARNASGRVQVETRNLEGFTLTPGRPLVSVSIDGAVLRVRPAASYSFEKKSGRWRAGEFVPSGKRPGAEGPIAAAVTGWQIYVYGTLGARAAAELDSRRKIAETAANWSTSRAPLRLSLPVKADKDVTAEDIATADLVLFGNRDTNSLIARFAPLLPLALHPDAADYGLLFVAPGPSHYLLVSSGLPWWTGADDCDRGGYQFAPPQLRLLSSFGDYILFKGSLADVVAEGRFDGNWKVASDSSAKMLATGTVTIQGTK
jgi:fermentation-respiration switch protein FrsA (DUF1100 family)